MRKFALKLAFIATSRAPLDTASIEYKQYEIRYPSSTHLRSFSSSWRQKLLRLVICAAPSQTRAVRRRCFNFLFNVFQCASNQRLSNLWRGMRIFGQLHPRLGRFLVKSGMRTVSDLIKNTKPDQIISTMLVNIVMREFIYPKFKA